VYGDWIDAHGGINGHPLKVITCDDHGDPNTAASCARQAVSDNVTAVVGSFTSSESVIPILAAAHTAYFGTCCALYPADFTSSNSFPFGSQWALDVGLGAAAGSMCSRTGLVNFDAPIKAIIDSLYASALKGYGKSLKTIAYVPLTGADLSPEAAQVSSGTDCTILSVTQAFIAQLLGPLQQSGATQRLFGLQGNLSLQTCASYKSLCDNAIVDSVYPDMSSSVWSAYRAALKTYGAKPGLDYDSLGGLGTWAAYIGFTNIVKNMHGPTTAAAFLNAASQTTDLQTGGLVPPLNFTKPFPVKTFARMFNPSVAYSVIKNGTIQPLDNQFHDMTPAFAGAKAGV
jgi:hypothetical protein